MAFPENLQYLRSRNNVTQEQLAEILGVSRQSVSKWESGASFPEMETLLRVCDLYGVDLDTLLRGDLADSFKADTDGYDRFMDRFSLRVTCSVGAIIAAVAVMILLRALGVHEMLSVSFFMLALTVSVMVLVVSGIEEEHFRKKHPFIQDFYTEEARDAFHHRFVWYIAGGVGAILLDVALLIAAFAFLPDREPYTSIITAVFLLFIAGAVMSFTYGGMQKDKFKIWKYNRDNAPTPEAKKRLGQIGTACGCIMLAVTAIYVALGLTRNAWGSAWWLFPVGGIGCAIVSTILNPYKEDGD